MQDLLLFIQHHSLLSALLAVIVLFLIILEFMKLKSGTLQLTPAQVTQLINHDNAAVIDIRSQDAYKAGHIIGAISIPLQELQQNNKKIAKFKSQPIVLVCANGHESQRAATTLAQQGLQAQILAGGIRAWSSADMPLVKG